MHTQTIAQLLVAACTLTSVAAQANWLSPNRIPSRERRAPLELSLSLPGLGTGVTADGSSSSALPTSSTSSTPAVPTSTSSTPPPTTTTPPPTTSSTKPPATTSSPPKSTSTTSSAEPVTETSTQVVTKTNSDGSVTSYTTATTVTQTPGLSQNGSGTSSMSPQTRNTVIGVVVGVGGAIILGALALLAWRIWGRRKAADDGDGLATYGAGYGGGMEKSEVGSSPGGTMTSRTPFQSTLESYHAPTHVNASSNF